MKKKKVDAKAVAAEKLYHALLKEFEQLMGARPPNTKSLVRLSKMIEAFEKVWYPL